MTGTTLTLILICVAALGVLAYRRAPGWLWTTVIAIGLGLAWTTGIASPAALTPWIIAFVIIAVPLNIGPVRRALISSPILNLFKKILPQISQTEQEALDAGSVWWDGDLFSGKPDWKKMLNYPKPKLTAEEQAFVDGPAEKLCSMLDEWRFTHELNDLSPEVWQFIKDNRFFGMIIPKEYGGLGFSAIAHSEVVTKLATRSATGASTVMVPNSLGPAELLLHYGTEKQKSYYLPRLAKGEEIPCFGLTGPDAGSDAGSIPDHAIICKAEFQGKKDVLGMRVTWEKRYITLGPVATLLGLAFKAYDPDHLLGDEEDLGITLALIPTDTPGVEIGRRHCPLDAAFMNGPNSGKNVFIPMEWIVGGQEYIGQGWRMLMECLAAGRSISLPGSGTGATKLAARVTGAYSRIRVQFKTPIGKFEGIEEPLARIGGYAYMMEAARVMTAGAVDLGEKPSVISAIVKYHLTERARVAIIDAMDVHGGKGICMGPNNYLGLAYQQIPIGITVEGANILTRNMIIFGQGAIRCHPYVLREINATKDSDASAAVREFDDAFFGHIRFIIGNALRSFWLGLPGVHLIPVPGAKETKRYYRQLTRLSSALALLTDASMFILGGSLKRRERISARLGDILSMLYLSSATLKRYEDDGRQTADLPFLHWSIQDALDKAQEAFDGVLKNFPNRPVAWILRALIFPLGKPYKAPGDNLGHQVASLMLEPSSARDRLTRGTYVPDSEKDPVGVLEYALRAVIAAEPIETKLRAALKSGQIQGKTQDEQVAQAQKQGVIGPNDVKILERANSLRRQVIMVDDFDHNFGRNIKAEHAAPKARASM